MTIVDLGIGDYDDVVEIGGGTFSTVYQGRQRSFDRPVAIKVLTVAPTPDGRRQFQRECEAIGRLSGHPGIVTVYDAATGDDGRCYLVMELLTGGSLAELLAGADRLDVAHVLRIGVSLAGALESAHRAGVVHGDVKPENVLLSRFGDPKLADFGVATIRTGPAVAPPGVPGTLAYAAPELLGGGPPTPATDVYALAATLHTLLAGRPPFAREGDEGVASLAARIAAGPPDDLRSRDVPEALCEVLRAGLSADPARRQSGILQLGRQLQAVQARAGHPVTPLVVEGDEGADGGADEGDDRPGPPLPDAPSRRRPLTRWCRLAGSILLVAGAFGLLGPGPGATSVRLEQLYADDFDIGGGWYVQDEPIATVAYDGGWYRMDVRQPGQQFLSDTAFRGPAFGRPLTRLRDVSVRVTARSQSGTGLFGVVCRQGPGRTSFYEGLVGVDGTVRVVKFDAGRMVTLASTVTPKPARDQALVLRLDCAGAPAATRLRMFVDGRDVVDVVDSRGLPAGSIGLATATAEAQRATVAFDDFTLFGLESDGR